MSIFEGAAELAAFLEKYGVSYAVLGGLAVQHWGEPRAEKKADILIFRSLMGQGKGVGYFFGDPVVQ